jgi:hypothetical protein
MKTVTAKRNTKINTPWGVLEFAAGSTMKADIDTNICGLKEITVRTKFCNVYLGALETSDWEVFSPVSLRRAA